ncbi:hypothetical protein AB4212_69150, partial [Streptomyces sp. 2MCAF27]
VVLACLAPDPRDRPTAREVWDAFERPDPATPPPVPTTLPPVPVPVPEPVAESAPELTREQRAHGWTPLSDQDPRSLGPFTLHGHIRTHGSTTVYLGRGPDGEYAVLRTMGPRTRRRSALLALSTEAQALQRMRGDYAPRLMGQDLQAELPWIAEEHVLTADGALARTLTTLLSDGTVRSW